jgi:UDP-glucose 4-epimerase
MTNALVTGGAGFIGSHIVEALVRRGDRVRVVDDLSTGNAKNLAAVRAQIEFLHGDICDPSVAARAVRDVEVVFHEAALPSVPRSIEAPLETHAKCATATLHMLDQARQANVRRFVYAASSSAYGNMPKPAKQETDPCQPLSPYAAGKLAGEMYCQSFFHSYGFETVCLRYFNVFGPRQDPNSPYSAVIPLFISKMVQGTPPTVYGDGGQSRDFVYIDNVVNANLLAAQATGAPGLVFNVGCGVSFNLLHLITSLNRILGTDLKPNFEAPRVGDVRDSLADISLARSVLGFDPKVDLEEGLRRTAAFFRK